MATLDPTDQAEATLVPPAEGEDESPTQWQKRDLGRLTGTSLRGSYFRYPIVDVCLPEKDGDFDFTILDSA